MPYEGNQGNYQPKQMYEGDWKCAKCGAAITTLPFDPDPNRLDQLQCRDCHQARKKSYDQNRY